MRPSHAVALTLLLVSCAHAPKDAMPTLSGTLDGFDFDRDSLIAGPEVMVRLGSDGTWSGGWRIQGVWANAGPDTLIWVTARLTDGLIQSSWGDVPVRVGPRYVSVREASTDLVLRRADGGPVPEALVVPLWLIMRTWQLAGRPVGRCVEVEGIGTVQLFALPRRSVPYQVTVENRCSFSFVDPAVVRSGGSIELPAGEAGEGPPVLASERGAQPGGVASRSGVGGMPPADLTGGPPAR